MINMHVVLLDHFPEYVRELNFFRFLSDVGSHLVRHIEQLISLGGLYSLLSFVAMLVAVWTMQVTTAQANWKSTIGRILWAKRIAIGLLAIGLTLNMLTPFIIPEPPWLSSIPVLLGVVAILLLHGIEIRYNFVKIVDKDE